MGLWRVLEPRGDWAPSYCSTRTVTFLILGFNMIFRCNSNTILVSFHVFIF